MTRRNFLKGFTATIAFVLAAPTNPLTAISAIAPNNDTRPGWDCLPTHPCHEIIHQASDYSLLEWWTKYGAGHVAWQYRDVPRRHILYILNQRHIVPFEHIGR